MKQNQHLFCQRPLGKQYQQSLVGPAHGNQFGALAGVEDNVFKLHYRCIFMGDRLENPDCGVLAFGILNDNVKIINDGVCTGVHCK